MLGSTDSNYGELLQDFLCFFLTYYFVVCDCDDASNRSVFALIPKLTQDNQNKTKTIIK